MKSDFLLTILVIFMTNALFAQDGFTRIITHDDAYHFEIKGTVFCKDSLFILGNPWKQNNLWEFNVIGMDSIGNWDLLPDFNDDPKSFVAGSKIHLFTYDKIRDELYGVMQQKDDIMLFKSDVYGKHQWTGKIKGLPNSGVIRFSAIVRVNDGYIICGNGQFTGNFLLKVDEIGNHVYWSVSGANIYNRILVDSDTTFVSYGKVSPYFGVHYVTYNALTGKVIKIYEDQNAFSIYNMFKNPNDEGYIAVGDVINDKRNYFFPHVVWYDSKFNVKNKTQFGIRSEDSPPLPQEIPFRSIMDNDGNIYAAKLDYMLAPFPWTNPDPFDIADSKVLIVSKININGKIEWQSVDTVMVGVNGNAIADDCTSVDLSPSGSLYVSGYLSNPIPPDIYYKRQGWVVKYPKRENKNTTTSSEQTVFDDQILSLYPNPTSDKLVIRTHGLIDDALVIITDNTGKIVLKNRIISDAIEVDVRHFISGIYFASLSQNGQVIHTQKFIKQ